MACSYLIFVTLLEQRGRDLVQKTRLQGRVSQLLSLLQQCHQLLAAFRRSFSRSCTCSRPRSCRTLDLLNRGIRRPGLVLLLLRAHQQHLLPNWAAPQPEAAPQQHQQHHPQGACWLPGHPGST